MTKDEALEKKAENARELGLDYEPITPPQRTWVGLEFKDMPDNFMGNRAFIAGANWAAKQLKEKNVPKA